MPPERSDRLPGIVVVIVLLVWAGVVAADALDDKFEVPNVIHTMVMAIIGYVFARRKGGRKGE